MVDIYINIRRTGTKIDDVEFIFDYENEYYLMLQKLFLVAESLHFCENDNGTWRLSAWLRDLLFLQDDYLWAGPYWPRKYCYTGYTKSAFVDFQVLAFHIRLLIDEGRFTYKITDMRKTNKIYVHMWRPKRRQDDIRRMIKYAKSHRRVKLTEKCKIKLKEAGMIPICCVCYHEPYKILKRLTNE